MAAYPSDDELAQLQKLSSDFEPEVTGPLVGQRQSSAAITTQYATADPVFQVKTAALPAKYAYFRTCRGDGHCGWRAIAFTYFEALVRLADVNKFAEEEARLNSLGNLLEHIGYSRDIWIDFAEEAFELLHKLANSLRNMDGQTADILLNTFNSMGESMAIITYVKLLASAWIQTHADNFRHFIDSGDVKGYCANFIEPTQCEADNIGVAALAEALVKPAGFGLEVWYLDRSPGEEINRSFYLEPTDAHHRPIVGAPMLRLLYRPGHYDILYKAEDVPQVQHQPVPPQQPLHVALANYTDDFLPTATNVGDVMNMIPGMYPSGVGLGQRWPSLSLSYDFSPTPASLPQVTPVQPYAPAPTPVTPVSASHMDFVTSIHSVSTNQYNPPSHHSIHLEQPPVSLPIHPPPPVSIERAAPVGVERGGPFRPSMYELEPGFGSSMQVQQFQTAIFRNSHFNTAHFMNPDFSPEQWNPDGEYATGNKGRHKSHSS
ncbi:Peptidase-C65 domain containing protein [Pyrenophora tritici-repentis]|nr:Peptidase-C65 domain-containing protein [Pyrenophora tritici-repentis]KAF7444494.1 Peptidase-C65 domain containing protein [Pyrenophora tritici-repentis]KAF7564852.1 Peptidase-C65 domain containing protein [Pyrenophora tritici-repentis]KAG9378734.1 Peptidase-C65 domain containing protein [Pyrenophora tritici-repentis]KAI0584272.1 Peptidase-C65 domain-containing protein [Pyrenophora tritici-repentis]